MKTQTSRFNFRLLLWLGPMFIVMGISAGVVANQWVPIPIALIALGVLMIGAGLFWPGAEIGNQPTFWRRRSTQAGTNALISTLSMLVILGLLNVLGVRHSQRIDLSEAKLFTLSSASQQVLQELLKPVKLWVFANDQNPQDRDLLETYRRQSPKFSFEYVDPDANPGVAERFGIKNTAIAQDVYLELPTKNRKKLLQSISPQIRLSENRITNGLIQITSDRLPKVYFLQGHGEKSLVPGEAAITRAVKGLEDKNLVAQPLTLAQTAKVPADAAVVAVMGPTRSLLASEIKALTNYLAQGGNLLVAIDPLVKAGLEPLLSDWGVSLDDRVAINASEQAIVGAGPAVLIVTQYGNHPITKSFQNNISFYPLSRPIDITPIAQIKATPLLLTDPKSWAESDLKQKPLKLDSGDRPGPLTIGVALDRPVKAVTQTTAQTSKTSRLVVLGNSTFALDRFFGQQLNGDVFMNSVNWLTQQSQQPLAVQPKDVKNRRITLTVQQASLLALVMLALPIVALGLAGLLWWQRR